MLEGTGTPDLAGTRTGAGSSVVLEVACMIASPASVTLTIAVLMAVTMMIVTRVIVIGIAVRVAAVVVQAEPGEQQPAVLTEGLKFDTGKRDLLALGQDDFEDSVSLGEQAQVVQPAEDGTAKDVTAKISASIGIDEAGTLDAAIAQKAERQFGMTGGAEDKYAARREG